MTFEEWADCMFGADFKGESVGNLTTYFRMSAALKQQPKLVLHGRTEDGKAILPPAVSSKGTELWAKLGERK